MQTLTARRRDTPRHGWLLLAIALLGPIIPGCGSNTVQMGSGPQDAKSPLFAAIEAGDLDSVKAELARDTYLLDQAEGSFAETPLHKAVRSRQLEIARYLIESGAEVNLFDNLSRTPLAAAIDADAGPDMIDLLESYGAID